MFTEIRDISTLNKEEILALRIADYQQNFIETTIQCLNEAENDQRFIPVGLYKENVAVGFAMYGVFQHEDETERVWLDRYLIDERYQHKGLGKYFLQQLIHFLTRKYHCQKLYLSVYDDNKVAIQLYKKIRIRFQW